MDVSRLGNVVDRVRAAKAQLDQLSNEQDGAIREFLSQQTTPPDGDVCCSLVGNRVLVIKDVSQDDDGDWCWDGLTVTSLLPLELHQKT